MTEETSYVLKASRPKPDIEDARLAASIGRRLFGRTTTAQVGRFRIDGRLGSGGMGVVYEAYDPRLQRHVALKVLRAERAEATAGDAPVLREARAAAKIRHPHVVEIFDTGHDAQQVWIAMELCPGPNLRRWLQARARPWRQVLALFLQCGEALAAGHRLGVVHRDFKPHNVIVEELDSGEVRAKVVDFGLAAVEELAGHEGAAAVGGTPGYVAPEQRGGRTVDGRADQYSFCVALHEALMGAKPGELAEAPPPARAAAPTRGRVPGWVHAAIARGLDEDPAQRFDDMSALVLRLRRGLARRGRVIGGMLGVTTAVAVGGGLFAVTQRPPDPCLGAATAAEEVWGDARKEDVSAWFRSADAQRPDAATEFVGEVDGWIEGWRAHAEAVCRRVQSRSVSASVDDLSRACLERRLAAVDGLITGMVASKPTVGAATQAQFGARQLPGTQACDDAPRLLREVVAEGPASVLEAIGEHDRQIAALGGRLRFAFYGDAIDETAAAVEKARSLGHAPLLARALRLHGHALNESGQAERAAEAARQAYLAAIEGRTDLVASEGAMLLGWIHVMRTRKLDEAGLWLDQAKAWNEGLDDPASWAEWHDIAGGLAYERAQFDEAERHYTEALRLREATPRARGSEWSSLNGLSMVRLRQGDPKQALRDGQAALASLESVMGSEHPYVAQVLNNIGAAAQMIGDYPRAHEYLLRALRIKRQALGEGHPELGSTLLNLGSVEWALGQHDDALHRYERSIEIRERALGPEHVTVADGLFNLGLSLMELARHTEALAHFRRAHALYRAAHGDRHPHSISSRIAAAQCLLALEDTEEARALLTGALADSEGVALQPVDRAELLLELARIDYDEPPRRSAALARAEEAERLCSGRDGVVCDGVAQWLAPRRPTTGIGPREDGRSVAD